MNPKEQTSVPDDPKSQYERMQAERGVEHDEAAAPNQNRPPTEQHRSGPLPNQKK